MEKYDDNDIPYMKWKIKVMFETTNQGCCNDEKNDRLDVKRCLAKNSESITCYGDLPSGKLT